MAELTAELADMAKEVDRLRNARTLTQVRVTLWALAHAGMTMGMSLGSGPGSGFMLYVQPGWRRRCLLLVKGLSAHTLDINAGVLGHAVYTRCGLSTHTCSATVPQTGVDEIRESYRRKLEGLMRDVTDLGRAVAIMQVCWLLMVLGAISLLAMHAWLCPWGSCRYVGSWRCSKQKQQKLFAHAVRKFHQRGAQMAHPSHVAQLLSPSVCPNGPLTPHSLTHRPTP